MQIGARNWGGNEEKCKQTPEPPKSTLEGTREEADQISQKKEWWELATTRDTFALTSVLGLLFNYVCLKDPGS